MGDTILTFDGLADLREALRQLPIELTKDGGDIVSSSTIEAADAIIDAYPEGPSGHLKGGVRTSIDRSGQFGVVGIVRSTAKHAWIFENGTQARHTELGANRGAMPPGHVFVPIVMRKRRAMYEKLKALLASKGLEVSGDAD